MDRGSFDRFLSRLTALDPRQQERACLQLAQLLCGERTAAIIEQARRGTLACPRCRGTYLHGDGHKSGLQRYRCRQCGRSFNALTGTPLARLRLKDHWLAYFDCLRDPACTVHSAAAIVGIHPNTSFRWRHRFLAWVKLDRPSCLQGIVEADELFLLESEKGSWTLKRQPRKSGGVARRRGISAEHVTIVLARDRAGGTIDFIAGRGAFHGTSLDQHLLPKLAPDVLLVSKGKPAYRRFARRSGIAHRTANVSLGIRTIDHAHLQNVNAYQSRFNDWLRHFNGVATKYLSNYLGWRWAIDLLRIDAAETFLRAALGVFRT